MQFYRRTSTRPRRLGVLAGGFNPPTVAHVGLALAARDRVDEVLCVVPREFPHKKYFGATLDQRLEMLGALNWGIPHSIASTDRGLFVDIAGECATEFGSTVELAFLCGRDAAERILQWDYGRAGVVNEMLSRFELLVASRGGDFEPPEEFRRRIHALAVPGDLDPVSSSEVRERIGRGIAWEHLVPDEILEKVREIYS